MNTTGGIFPLQISLYKRSIRGQIKTKPKEWT